jgi:hypothetical protein
MHLAQALRLPCSRTRFVPVLRLVRRTYTVEPSLEHTFLLGGEWNDRASGLLYSLGLYRTTSREL